MPFLIPIIALTTSMVTASVIMRWLLVLCRKHGIYDNMTKRGKSKKQQIPRIGGAVFLPALIAGLTVTILLRLQENDVSSTIHLSTLFIGCGALGIYLLGIIDDIIGISAHLKWCIKSIACASFPLCALIINNLYGLLGINELGLITSYIITFLATLFIVEAVNATDDTDGLAASLALLVIGVLTFQFYTLGYHTYAYFGLSLAGALIAFLCYNVWGDERIGTKVHMGNCGSLILGFSLAYMTIKYAMDNKHVMTSRPDGLLFSYSLLIMPIFDYLLVSVKSLFLGVPRRPLRLQYTFRRCGYSDRAITGLIVLFSIGFFCFNKALHHHNVGLTAIVVLDVVIYALLRIVADRIAKAKSSSLQEQGVIRPHKTGAYKGVEGLVSVIMPTWNSAQYVAQSIESILAQSYSNLELIITDDASTDNTPDILREYAEHDSRVHIILNKTNGGAGRSRNCSIEAARGRYIAFCDSDDRWDPHKLELQLAFMQDKDVALCFCPYYTCGPDNEYLGYVSAPRRVSLFTMMCDNKIGFLTAIYDTARLGKHFMPSQRKRQDHALLLMLMRTCRYAYSVDKPLAHYRLHPGNMSANKMGLLRFNAKTYNSVFGWPAPLCYAFLFTFFMPSYFWKRVKNICINIWRTQLG